MINISTRLEKISSLISKNSTIIDIGCDHALLDIYLYQKGNYKIIATDINQNALNNAKKNIKKYNLDQYIETRLGNGLEVITESDNIDTIIISGMGAHTIVGILKKDINKLKTIKTIIIQSNTKLEFLRKEMTKLNFKIEDEIIVEYNKKVYIIIKFTKGKIKYTKKEIYFGPILLNKKPQLFVNNSKKELEKLKLLLKLLPKNRVIDRYKIKRQIKLYNDI